MNRQIRALVFFFWRHFETHGYFQNAVNQNTPNQGPSHAQTSANELGLKTHATQTLLPDSLSTILQRHPQVSISLEEHTSPDVVMAVARAGS